MSRFSRARKSPTVEGRRAVLESLRSGRGIERILMADGVEMGPQIKEIIFLADQANVAVDAVSRQDLERQSSTKKHQGVIALVPDHRYVTVEDLIFVADERGDKPLIAVLDGVQDPHNLGAIARTVDAAGGHGLVIPERRAASVTPGAMRASAGALEHVPVARMANLSRAVEVLQQVGVHVVGLDADADHTYTDHDYTGPTAIVVGAEGEGISRLVRERCDTLVSIPLQGKLASLNASVSAGIVLYEAVRQRLAAHSSEAR
ncbi:MAG: 23S rRNA (guanosine(2251)-2'-O)-methyltransferase RlmB [Dehalococcoidia bacterium]